MTQKTPSILDLCVFLNPKYKDYESILGMKQMCKKYFSTEIKKLVEITTENLEEENSLLEKTTSAFDLLFPEEDAASTPSTLSELDIYIYEPKIKKSSSTLNWWSMNQRKFPYLSILAKKYLSVPATSIPAERIFATAGNIVSAKRACTYVLSTYVLKLIPFHC